jgi:uroporphyrinogen decarboxylase
MTSRDRVLTTLAHEEPDRVPLFVGTSGVTTLLGPAYERLKAHLGIHNRPPAWISSIFGYALMDEEAMRILGSDGRPLVPGPIPSSVARTLSPECIVDAWGVTWTRPPDSLYYDVSRSPLAEAVLADLDRYPWPDLAAESRFVGLADQARNIQKAGYATVYVPGITLFDQACMLRGQANLLMDILADKDFFTALMTKLLDLFLAHIQAASRHIGKHLDMVVTACDLGGQNVPLISPACYRDMLKPMHARLFAAIKREIGAKVFFHSCGNIYPLLGDFIDVGVDIINPVQVSAGEMSDTARLKREFGQHLTFNGGIDTRWVLPRGSVEDVRAEVRRRIRDLAPGGGYIASAVHCIQPDVPPENVVAMCEEVKRAGQYPLQLTSE